jgi:hypothetical protein
VVHHGRVRGNPRTIALALALGLVASLGGGCGAPPTPPPSSNPAQLQSVRTDVFFHPQQGAPQPVAQGQTRALATGDGVDVSPDGEAEVRFQADALVVRVFRSSSIQLTASVDPNAPGALQFRLLSGAVFNTVDAAKLAGQRVRVTTEDGAVIDAAGTEFLVYWDTRTKSAWNIVTQGQTQVSAQGATVTVPQGMQTWVDPNQRPVTPVPANRQQVGNKFPDLAQLTGGRLSDRQVLTAGPLPASPAASVGPASKPSPGP